MWGGGGGGWEKGNELSEKLAEVCRHFFLSKDKGIDRCFIALQTLPKWQC